MTNYMTDEEKLQRVQAVARFLAAAFGVATAVLEALADRERELRLTLGWRRYFSPAWWGVRDFRRDKDENA